MDLRKALFAWIVLALVHVLRVDWWWWGKIGKIYGGWFSAPMLYQTVLFFIGWAVVIYSAYAVWKDDE